MISKLEVNLARLLAQCEKMASASDITDNWKLEKYVMTLGDLLKDLRKSPSCPTKEVAIEYERRIKFLEKLLEAEKLPNVIEKSMASNFLNSKTTSSSAKFPREIHLHLKSKYDSEVRKELFGGDKDKSNSAKNTESEDMNSILRYHQEAQEKLADEMVILARNMKENSLYARNVVKKDLETLGDSCTLADQNYSRLKVESETLEEHTQKACNWWIWMMLVIVCTTFVIMVLFMKMFPKS